MQSYITLLKSIYRSAFQAYYKLLKKKQYPCLYYSSGRYIDFCLIISCWRRNNGVQSTLMLLYWSIYWISSYNRVLKKKQWNIIHALYYSTGRYIAVHFKHIIGYWSRKRGVQSKLILLRWSRCAVVHFKLPLKKKQCNTIHAYISLLAETLQWVLSL